MSRITIITGSSRGLGLELFRLISAREEFLTSLSLDFSAEQKNQASQSSKIQLLKCDLSSREMVNKSLEKIAIPEDCHEIVFINNAGIIEPICPIENASAKAIELSVAINFLSPVLIVKWLTALNDERISLKIINISSGAALRPIAGWSMYCSTKAAFRMFLDTLSLEKPKVDLVHFDPGVMNTLMQAKIRSKESNFPDQDKFKKLKDKGALREPIEVARQIVKDLLK